MTKQKPRIILITDPDCEDALKWLDRHDWCRGVIVPLDTSAEGLESLINRPWEIICQMPGHPQTLAFQYEYLKKPLPDIKTLLHRAYETLGDRMHWLGLVEEDSSGVAFPQALLREKPTTHAQAYAMLKQRLHEGLEPASELPEIQLSATVGFAMNLHAHAATGVSHLTLERTNDDVDDLQTGIAFCRGAAKQYQVPTWGIDFSLWWGAIVGPGYLVQKLPASYHRRNLFIAAFSGAQALIMEGMARGKDCVNPDNPPAIAKAVEQVGTFFGHFDPGKVQTPVAVMLPEDHGWMTRPYWQGTRTMCSYAHVPCRPGDRGIDGFFGTAFPGSPCAMDPFPFGSYQSNDPPATPFGLSCIGPDFVPTPADIFDAAPYIPFGRFHDRAQAKTTFTEQNIDPAPYRPMATSRWGDIFDVLTTDVTLDLINEYPVLVLLGAIELTDELNTKFLRYVHAGGKLVLSAGVATPQHSQLIGMDLEPELRMGRAWSWDGQPHVHEPFRYLPAKLHPQTLCIAKTNCGQPLVACHSIGQGQAWTTTVPWFQGVHTDHLDLCVRLWDHVISQVQPVHVEGLPVQWVTAVVDDAMHVLVVNHDPTPWQGCVTVNRDLSTAISLMDNQSLKIENNQISLSIPAYDLAIIKAQ